ncbi:hypothetical protein V8O11_13570 [Erwinia aphidicola]|uniref:hypothetical protein n=1 Tax=Erwinia TaxID=551 RepID=UPI0010613935|nr:hypothetical protein [Erwinia aphidicola]MCP2230789.1 hypothetical protein [Erwinia aphidicola]
MMKCKIVLSLLFIMTCSASASNVIRYGDFTMYMDKKERSIIHVVNDNGKSDISCKIKNWQDKYNTGGDIAITNDEKGVLIYPTNKYLSTNELMQCNAKGIELHKIPQSDDKLDTIVDINFDKRLVLLVALKDVRSLTYTAIVSSFDSNKNLLSGPGFFSGKESDIPFDVGDNQYGGKISLDGKYVSPIYLSCFVDSFPGLWDIKKNKRVVFDTSLDDDEIKDRCQKLFDGKATLEELGGKLIKPKK